MYGEKDKKLGFDNINDRNANLIKKKKQIILYGPPGTGKTYHTKFIAVQLLEKE